MQVNKKTYLYICEETECSLHKTCGYGIPHVCKRSHVCHYCYSLRKEVNCIPSSQKITYVRCVEARSCNRSRGRCRLAVPDFRRTHYQTCPYDNNIKISFEEYDTDLLERNSDNEYLKRMGY